MRLRSAIPAILGYYYVTTVVVVVGVYLGLDVLGRVPYHAQQTSDLHRSETSAIRGFAAWDGVWYARIAEAGYEYSPAMRSSVAFFPGYPLCGRAIAAITGIRVEAGLLIVSHAALIAGVVVFWLYLKSHPQRTTAKECHWILLAACLWPTTFFFRMTYSESLFLLLVLLTMIGIQRRWPCVVIALIAGAATATRAAGVALIPVLLWHEWSMRRSIFSFLLHSGVVSSLGCGGLGAYIAFQHAAFDDPFAFARTQQHWAIIKDHQDFPERIGSLLVFEPLWSVYDSSSPAFWSNFEATPNFLFSLQFWNPIYFSIATGLVIFGTARKWLTTEEWLLSAGLLFIPYLTHSYRAGMMGHARYASVVFPAYIVMGKLLSRCPPPLAGLLCALSGLFLGLYSALFAAWYRMI